MVNENRLIEANALLAYIHNHDYELVSRMGCVDKGMFTDGIEHGINIQPTVDAVVLPCKIGDDVYIIPSKVNFDLNNLARHKENNRVYHQKVANIVFTEDGWYMTGSADLEWGTGKILLDKFYQETWFLTSKEAEAALAKMDGGNEDG